MTRSLLVAPGPSPSHEYILKLLPTADQVIAIDGGADILMKLGYQPEFIIGDLDSMSKAVRYTLSQRETTHWLTYPKDKDKTDGQLALEFVLDQQPRPDEIIFCGAFGGHVDHSLGLLLFVASLGDPGAVIWLTDGTQWATPVHRFLELGGTVGDRVSFIPLTPRVSGITLRGFRYELTDGTLAWGQTLGISNRLSAPKGRVFVSGDGILFAVHASGSGNNTG